VIIDGSYENRAAYARLHRIAEEEGLRSLGARDPGHLELPRDGRSPRHAPGSPTREGLERGTFGTARAGFDRLPGRARSAAPEGVASVARVAEPVAPAVARLAAVASPMVAAVASVGVPAVRSRGHAPDRPEPASAPLPDLPRVPAGGFANGGAPAAGGTDGFGSNPLRSGAAQRIAHLLDLQDSAPIRPMSQVLLRVDGPTGEDRIRLDLRGLSLDATIEASDPAAAERLRARLGDLQRALEQKGLHAESLRVRSAPQSDSAEISKLAAAVEAESSRPAAARGGSDPITARDRQHDSAREQPRHDPGDPRQRSRKDSNGGKTT
jgi:hypothetical protein